jgi:DNA-binding NarL/FixJ family response regulator
MTGENVEGERIRVLIVDDHQIVRQGLRTFLSCTTTSRWW